MGSQKVIEEFPIASYLSRFVTVYDGGGVSFRADCFHCSGKGTFSVNRLVMGFHCFRCNPRWGGHGPPVWEGKAGLVKLVRLLERCERKTAWQRIFQLTGAPVALKSRSRVSRALVPEEAVPLAGLPESEPAVAMLIRRGVQHLIPLAFVAIGGRYHERLILPALHFDQLQGSECKSVYESQKPKSLLHPEAFPAGTTVYTSRWWNKESRRAVVTESIFDAEMFEGVENAIGTYGGGLTPGQSVLLSKMGIRELVWFLDGERNAWRTTINCIRKRTLSLFDNYVFPVPLDEDPNSLGRARCAELLETIVPVESDLDLLTLSANWGLL